MSDIPSFYEDTFSRKYLVWKYFTVCLRGQRDTTTTYVQLRSKREKSLWDMNMKGM